MIDKKTFTIGVLAVTALILLVANLMLPQPAAAEVAVKDRDYTAVTGRTTKGGDALFLTDNRTGMMAVFVYDPNRRALTPLDVRSLTEAFAGGGRTNRAVGEAGGGRNADRAVNR
jgi:hypothetical protein